MNESDAQCASTFADVISRRFFVSIAPVALVAALASCSSEAKETTSAPASTVAASTGAATSGAPADASTAPTEASGITVTGGPDETPKLVIPTTTPPTTLIVEMLTEGSGPELVAGDNLTANYHGVLWRDGSEFDSSWTRGQPATFPVGTGNLIAAWDEALVGVKYGSRVLLVVPPDKGYGAAGTPDGSIKGDDTMIFVIDLIQKA
jgi:FKBP-type peptidyl-prolyl cis-trans isomerase